MWRAGHLRATWIKSNVSKYPFISDLNGNALSFVEQGRLSYSDAAGNVDSVNTHHVSATGVDDVDKFDSARCWEVDSCTPGVVKVKGRLRVSILENKCSKHQA